MNNQKWLTKIKKGVKSLSPAETKEYLDYARNYYKNNLTQKSEYLGLSVCVMCGLPGYLYKKTRFYLKTQNEGKPFFYIRHAKSGKNINYCYYLASLNYQEDKENES